MGNCSRKKTKAAEEDEGASGETKGKRRKGVSKEEEGRRWVGTDGVLRLSASV